METKWTNQSPEVSHICPVLYYFVFKPSKIWFCCGNSCSVSWWECEFLFLHIFSSNKNHFHLVYTASLCIELLKPDPSAVYRISSFSMDLYLSLLSQNSQLSLTLKSSMSSLPFISVVFIHVSSGWAWSMTARPMTVLTMCLWAASCLHECRPASIVTTGPDAAGWSCRSTCSEFFRSPTQSWTDLDWFGSTFSGMKEWRELRWGLMSGLACAEMGLVRAPWFRTAPDRFMMDVVVQDFLSESKQVWTRTKTV